MKHVCRILQFPAVRRAGAWRREALAPFWALPEEWRGTPGELEARFDLPDCVKVVRRTRGALAAAVEAQRKLARQRGWLCTAERLGETIEALSLENSYLNGLERRLRAQAAPRWRSAGEFAAALCEALRVGLGAEMKGTSAS